VGTSGNWRELEQQILKVIRTGVRSVGVAFLDAEPVGVKKFEGTQPSGCSFWRLAAEGRTFYTIPENHFSCAVGAYTHNIALSPEREKETEQTLKMMFDLGYVKPEEVPQIPRLAKGPKAIVYSPLVDAPVDPDVVLFALRPAAAMQYGAIASLGCIGNRVHTGLEEDEMYVVLRGKDLASIAEALHVISGRNSAPRDYARGRREQLSSH
jgi:uncharacterized protein (DUF169 family)